MSKVCKDYPERPGCLKEVDERWTLSFEDVNLGYIYFCSNCGPPNHELASMLEEALASGRITAKELDDAISEQEQKLRN